MDVVEGTLRVDGRLFRVEALHEAARGVWHAMVGEGAQPARWTRLPQAYDSAVDALAAAASGIIRHVGSEPRATGTSGNAPLAEHAAGRSTGTASPIRLLKK